MVRSSEGSRIVVVIVVEPRHRRRPPSQRSIVFGWHRRGQLYWRQHLLRHWKRYICDCSVLQEQLPQLAYEVRIAFGDRAICSVRRDRLPIDPCQSFLFRRLFLGGQYFVEQNNEWPKMDLACVLLGFSKAKRLVIYNYEDLRILGNQAKANGETYVQPIKIIVHPNSVCMHTQ